MTDKEKNIIYLLQQIYEEFCSLEIQHDSDKIEFVEALHRLQHLIMIRSVRRKNTDLFPINSSPINFKELEHVISRELSKKLGGESE